MLIKLCFKAAKQYPKECLEIRIDIVVRWEVSESTLGQRKRGDDITEKHTTKNHKNYVAKAGITS